MYEDLLIFHLNPHKHQKYIYINKHIHMNTQTPLFPLPSSRDFFRDVIPQEEKAASSGEFNVLILSSITKTYYHLRATL